MSLPDDVRADKALQFLESSEQEFARAVARRESAEQRRKLAKGLGFLEATGTAGEREARAETSEDYRAAIEELESAVYELELLKAKRARALLTIDLFRTLEASRRKGWA